MVKETARKCSHCGQNGHNSRTCNGKGCLKLFGVNISIQEEPENTLKKSFSMGNLESHNAHNIAESNNFPVDEGYLSDGHIHSKKNKAARERKRGKPWTDEEHRIFLTGLRKLGKGDWRGISKNFVTTRTPTQVASHAQKYFLRHAGTDMKKKRRASLFDMAFHELNSSSPPPLSSKETSRNSCQIIAQSQIVNRFPHLCLDDRMVPLLSFPSYYQDVQPMMVGVSPGQGFRDARMMPFLHAMKYAQALRNAVVCAPTAAHPSGIPSAPRSGSARHAPVNASTAEKDLLELKIGLPESPKNASQPSIRVI